MDVFAELSRWYSVALLIGLVLFGAYSLWKRPAQALLVLLLLFIAGLIGIVVEAIEDELSLPIMVIVVLCAAAYYLVKKIRGAGS